MIPVIAGIGRALGGATSAVARTTAAIGRGAVSRIAGRAGKAGGGVFNKVWTWMGGATRTEVRNANSVWERGALRQQNIATLDRMIGQLVSWANGFTHSISVAVTGGPGADLRRCYYLACAAAFGRFRNGVTTVLYHEFSSHWDVTSKTVVVTVAYATGATTAFINAIGQAKGTTPIDVIQRGPDQLTLGSSWPRFLKSLTGLVEQTPVSNVVMRGGMPVTLPEETVQVLGAAIQTLPAANNLEQWRLDQRVLRIKPLVPITTLQPWVVIGGADVLRELGRPAGFGILRYKMRVIAPVGKSGQQEFVFGFRNGTVALPDAGRVITTGEVRSPLVQPPRPPVDGISRGDIISVTIAALGSPGVLAELPDIDVNGVPVASTGYYPQGAESDLGPIGKVWVESNVPINPSPIAAPARVLTDNVPLLKE